LDAAVAGVNIQELDPEDSSVGYGGLPNEDGVVELDACVMHGPTRRAGSVASIRGIKTPSKVAKLVMERSDHIMLVGEGALRFAKAHGFQEEDLLTEKARLAWLTWKESLGADWGPGLSAPPEAKRGAGNARLLESFPGAKPEWIAWAREVAADPPTGTITCLTLNRTGDMSGCTTTSGLAWKIPGRVGDSPIIGAGLYVDQDVGAAGSTGRGEETIRVVGAHTVVENMRHGMEPEAACLDALRRVSRNFNDDRARLDQIQLSFYALRKDGKYGAANLWGYRKSGGELKRGQYVVNDGSGSRHADVAYLYEGR
jgi:N4-(beta-N-acetylglucosaminyl)-L-asparaginase